MLLDNKYDVKHNCRLVFYELFFKKLFFLNYFIYLKTGKLDDFKKISYDNDFLSIGVHLTNILF